MKGKIKILLCSLILLSIIGCVTINQNDYINPYTIEEINSKFNIPSDSLNIQGKYIMKAYGWRDYQLLELEDNKFHWESSVGCMVPADTTHINGTYYRINDTLKFIVEESFFISGLHKTRENIEIYSNEIDQEALRFLTMWTTKELKIRIYNNYICLLDHRSIGLIHIFLDSSPNTTIDEEITDMLPENRKTISTFYSKLKDE